MLVFVFLVPLPLHISNGYGLRPTKRNSTTATYIRTSVLSCLGTQSFPTITPASRRKSATSALKQRNTMALLEPLTTILMLLHASFPGSPPHDRLCFAFCVISRHWFGWYPRVRYYYIAKCSFALLEICASRSWGDDGVVPCRYIARLVSRGWRWLVLRWWRSRRSSTGWFSIQSGLRREDSTSPNQTQTSPWSSLCLGGAKMELERYVSRLFARCCLTC